jgi:Holliday junction resolvase RusA-like endonuclease
MSELQEFINRWWDRVDGELIIVVDTALKAISKERPRVGKSGHVYTPKRTKEFEKAIAELAGKIVDAPVSYPIHISITIWEAPPRTWPPEKRQLALAGLVVPTRGDLDNQVKAITDGLNGVAYVDDVQIARMTAIRQYGLHDRILVTISQHALSPVQTDHAVASLKALINEQGSSDTSGT